MPSASQLVFVPDAVLLIGFSIGFSFGCIAGTISREPFAVGKLDCTFH